MEELIKEKDYYWEGGYMVFTRNFHLKRGKCCGSGCRHCPYEPRWTKGTTVVSSEPATSPLASQCPSDEWF